MRKIFTAGLAALTLAGGALAAAAPAQAAPYRYGWHDRGYGPGPAIFAGVAGLALGAALADSHRYDGPYYARPYYHRYTTCYARRTVWDPYIQHYVVVSQPYAC
jgi:hypothetical protein